MNKKHLAPNVIHSLDAAILNQAGIGPDVYVPSENEAEAALADAALMNENMRLYGCIDKPKDVGVPYTCIDELQQF